MSRNLKNPDKAVSKGAGWPRFVARAAPFDTPWNRSGLLRMLLLIPDNVYYPVSQLGNSKRSLLLNMSQIKQLSALEILDSRGLPTLQVTCHLASGAQGTVSIPGGALSKSGNAAELRDGDPKRYRGYGCRQAVEKIEGELNKVLQKRVVQQQSELDQVMIMLDGTPNKARLGANTLLAVSLAFARAQAREQNIPLYHYFAALLDQAPTRLPRPLITLFNGGSYSEGRVPIQDLQIVPLTAQTMDQALTIAFDIYYAASDIIVERYGSRALKSEEGGLVPPFPTAEAMLDTAVAAIEAAHLRPGEDVALTIDVAASQFYQDEAYAFAEQTLSGPEMVELLSSWLARYPLVGLEDGLADEDWEQWQALTHQHGENVLILGDDLIHTNPMRVHRAIESQAINGVLLKLDQIGTLSEAIETYKLAWSAGWCVVLGARSGETEDDWLADLAVGWAGNYLKAGGFTQSERLAKYNRLLAIEATTQLPMARWKD